MMRVGVKKYYYGLPLVLIAAGIGIRAYRTIRSETLDVRPRRHAVAQPEGWNASWTVTTVVSRKGLRFACWFAASSNGGSIILVHGYGADRSQLWPEAQLLQSHGFGILLCDSRAHGESEGSMITYGQEEQYDIIDSIDWLRSQTHGGSTSIGGYGFSIGGLALALAASHEQRLAAVALASTPSSVYSLICDEHRTGCWIDTPWVLEALWRAGINPWPLSVQAEIHKVAPRPVLFIQGAHDIIVPLRRLEQNMAAAAEPKQSLILPDRAHGQFYETSVDLYAQTLLKFFETNLRP